MVIQKTISVVGSMVYWTLASLSDREKIVEGVTGLVKDSVPKRQITSAVRVALEDATAHRSCIVRPLEMHSGLVAMQEIRGSVQNEYRSTAYVKLSDKDEVCEIGLPGIYEDSEKTTVRMTIESRIQSALAECDHLHVAQFLANVIRSLGGITMRPSGGIYFVPEDGIEIFNKVVDVCQKAAIRGTSNVFQVRAAMDDLTVASVIDGLSREISERVGEIRDEFINKLDTMSDRVKANRREELGSILSKVRRYEGLLAVKLEDLTKLVETSEEVNVVSALCSSDSLLV